jgi:AraC family transcriptional regulator, regulatory protein of adaptative response / DNA-3-methyladenine glycosylase II
MIEDPGRCYQAALSKDARFDGWFFVAVTSTGIYCRPSCPARTPHRANMRFYPTAASAQHSGFRACLRCRPDATPGSPEWNVRADLVARAMRLIRDGVVDREGVRGLSQRLGYSARQLNRLVTAEVGAGPLALARAQRSQTARLLLETTDLPVARVAFAAGFSSVRQCNDTIRAVFAETPSGLRRRSARRAPGVAVGAPGIRLRLAAREPLSLEPLVRFLGERAIKGIESFDGSAYRRSLRLPYGQGVVTLNVDRFDDATSTHVDVSLRLTDFRDLTSAVSRCRQLLDLDADPVAVADALGGDPLLGPLVTKDPGRRVPGATDEFELAVRAVIGQQVSVAGARTVAARLVAAAGEPLDEPDGDLTHLFPTPGALLELAERDPGAFAMPAGRRRALVALARSVHEGDLVMDPGSDPAELRASLQSLPGVGPWTAQYVAMRALRDPDAFLESDLGVRRALERLDGPVDRVAVMALADAWRPWRSYAMMHLWSLPLDAARPTQPKGSAA